MKLSMVVPAYNEAGIVDSSVRRIDEHLRGMGVGYEILVGDDGSTDETARSVEALGLEQVRVVRRPHRGKGAILTEALLETVGDYAGFIDADLEIDITYVDDFVAALDDGSDAAVASKNLNPDLARERRTSRRLITGGYNLLVRTLFGSPLSDHQAGFKLFRGEFLRASLREIGATGWLWDTEVLVHYLTAGKSVAEIPVETRRVRQGHVDPIRTSWNMFWDLWRLYRSRRSVRRRGSRA